MNNEELQGLKKAYIKSNTADIAELGIWVSKRYIDNRRENQTVTLVCQHDFNPDIWIVEHKDGTEGAYANTELARNSRSE